MEEWKLTKIGSLCKRVCSGGTPKSTVEEYYGGGIPWLNTKEVNFNRIYSTESTISVAGLNNSSAKWIDKHSVIVAMYGATAAKCAIGMIPMTTNQACCNLMIDEALADYRFVYYALTNAYSTLASLANGGAQQNLNAQLIKDFEIPLPDLQTQHRIADILSTIDDKIENNTRINHNLEEQAQALYKSWFIDFEPFKDGKFVDSELGMIPDGWHVGTVNEIINIQSGFPFKSESFVERGQYLLITIKAVQDGQLTISGADSLDAPLPIKMPNYCILKVGDILLSLTGNVGRVCIVDRDKLLLNQRVANLAPKEEHNRAFTYFLARNEKFKDCMYQIARGTAQLNLSPVETGNLRIVIPPPDVMNHFSCVATPMFEAITTSLREMISLQSSRDSLLPQLLSGQLTC